MTIAKVEPLTTARALRGPFDYRIPDPGAGEGPVGIGTLLTVPFAGRKLTGVVVELAESSEVPDDRLAEPLATLGESAPPELVALGLWVARRYCSPPARGLALALPPGSGGRGRPRVAAPRTERRVRLLDAGRAALREEDGAPRLGARQRQALALLESEGELPAPELASRIGATSSVPTRLAELGLAEIGVAEVRRRPRIEAVGASATVELSEAQRGCADRLVAALEGEGPRERLLWGVTGSGKTEVYLATIEAAIAGGGGAILLVPEIGLTPQTLARVSARFGERAAVIHSALSEGERFDEWRRLRSGEARVCVGPRSAAFAPVRDLAALIVDEEHDSSYKQEGDPRYDARAVAMRRAEAAGALYVAGSATPRPESWAGLDRLELPDRVDGRGLPSVEVLDMRETSPRSGPLHPACRDALAELPEDGKAIVMLNRRGFAPHLACAECGAAVNCPNCDVSLVLHRGSSRMLCHHCGHSEPVPRDCRECGSSSLARYGAGTERIEELIGELTGAPVFRLDADAAARRGAHGRLLAEFERAQGGVLVGTQMVAKGHDFSDVVLSILLDADSTLRYPDFRAEERTFALVSQLAGRSGRGSRPGRVLVQTHAPEADPIVAAAKHDAPGFLAGELERRRRFGYPPFSSLVAVELAGPREAPLVASGDRLAANLGPALGSGSELLGPAPRFRRRGRFRRRLLVKTGEPGATTEVVREAVEAEGARVDGAEVAIAVDVDPQ